MSNIVIKDAYIKDSAIITNGNPNSSGYNHTVSVNNNTSPETVNPAWVVTDTFFAVNEDGRIVGIIDLRHTLNDFLQDFGNSGYSVRPTERRKGYATEMLRQLKDVAKQAGMTELHMATFQDNVASVKTIVKNGGVPEREFEAEGKPARMYVITL